MAREKMPAAEGLITSDAVTAGARLRRRLLVAIVGIIILAAVGAGVWLVMNKTSLLPGAAPKQHVDLNTLSPAEAIKAAQDVLNSAHTSTEKQTAYTTLGDTYVRSGQDAKGAQAYQQALVYSPDDIPLLERLSSSYTKAGDTAQAISILQKLIAALQATNIPDKNFLLSRYQGELDYLQGKGS